MADKGKSTKRKQKFKDEYKVTFDFISTSRQGESFAFCRYCRTDIRIDTGGANDIRKHAKTKKHELNEKQEKTASGMSQKITAFARTDDLSVTRAEVTFTDYLVEHSIPLACADHTGDLFRKMFLDSKIAKKYSCGRTKTCIVKTLAGEDATSLAQRMKSQSFSLATDGSTDMDAIKLYPILVKSFDDTVGQVVTELLSMRECSERSTAENIFKLLDSELTSWNIKWTNCVSFGTDNASVMIGKHKGVATLIKQKNPDLYVVGCPCHLMHLAAKKGGSCLLYQIDDLLVDIWYYIDKSSLRHQGIREMQREHGEEVRKILKHVATRWLSLGKAVNRLIRSWDSWTDFFKKESESNKGSKRKVPPDFNRGNAKKKLKNSSSSSRPKTQMTSSKQATGSSPTAKSSHTSTSTKPKDNSTCTAPQQHTSSTTMPKTSSKQHTCTSSSSKASHSSTSTQPKDASTSTANKQHTTTDAGTKPKAQSGSSKQFDINQYLFSQKQLAERHAKTKKTKSSSHEGKHEASAKKGKGTAGDKSKDPVECEHKSVRIYRQLIDPNCKLYAMFLHSTLPAFDHPNEVLQRDEPQIHRMLDVLLEQLSVMLSKFVKPKAVTEADDITKLDLDDTSLHKDNEDIQVGYQCKTYIKDNKDKLDVKRFYSNVKQFYILSTRYMIQNYPFKDDLLEHARVVDIDKRTEVKFKSVEYFVERFKLVPSEQMDELENEFNFYQVDPNIQCIVKSSGRIDQQWQRIAENEHYQLLPKVMKSILILYHSNADCERVFSIVGKNKTKERSSMNTQTLSSLMTHKLAMQNRGLKCSTTSYSDAVLRKAKSSTYQSLHEHAPTSSSAK